MSSATPIKAVTFDLDDTIYPQEDYLAGAWRAVAAAAGAAGVGATEGQRLGAALVAVAAEGSDRGGIIDRAIAQVGLPADLAPVLIAAFKGYAPESLTPYDGAVDALAALRRRVPVGLVTDGDPLIQRAKLAALGVGDLVDVIVISDELGGRGFRKPHPAPFLAALDALGGVCGGDAVHVGDRYPKDVAGATGVGMRAVRVLTGEYRHLADPPGAPPPWRTAVGVVDAIEMLLREIG